MLNRFWGEIGGAESENALSFAKLALVLEIYFYFFVIFIKHVAQACKLLQCNIICFPFKV